MSDDVEPTSKPERAPAFGLAFVGPVFASPSRVFRDLAARPRGAWLAPMVISALLTTAAAWIMLPEILDVTYNSAVAMMEKMGVPDAEMDEALAAMPLEPSPDVVVKQVLPNLITVPVLMLIGAAFIHFASRMFGSQSRFGATLGMFSVAYVVWAVGGLVRGAVAAASDTLDVTLGPGALIPSIENLSPFGIFLDLFDVFSIWHLVVLATGVAVVTRVSRGTGWGVAIAFWVIRSIFLAGGKAFMLWTQSG